MNLKYLEEEMEIAKDPTHPRHLMPDVNGRNDILDLGGGT